MKFLKVAVVLLVTVASLIPNVFAGDTKYYSEYAVEYKVNDKLDLFFAPYGSEEFYYDMNIEKIFLNWATIGVTKK